MLSLLGAPALAADPGPAPAFSAEEIAWSKGYGPGMIDGSGAFIDGKTAKTCAGEKVYLRPTSALEIHRNHILFGNAEGALIPVSQYLNPVGANETTMPAPPKDYDASARQANCSIDGRFLFTGIPDGDYHILTMIIPRALLGKVVEYDDIEVVMKRVTVAGGATVRVDLFGKP